MCVGGMCVCLIDVFAVRVYMQVVCVWVHMVCVWCVGGVCVHWLDAIAMYDNCITRHDSRKNEFC